MFGTEVFQVSPTIWCIRRRSYLTCSYILKRGDSAVLIDAGMASSGADVWRGLDAAGIGADCVEAVYRVRMAAVDQDIWPLPPSREVIVAFGDDFTK